ncbi:hypothetical protein QR680_014318 [Steinernema hermaphroditum]|uniref:C-type lectin domain-containing protein n=1 Tax=Steinernema hermaphroditum TaxID=289476 RepID=A0AA39I8H2_9BILA|nr:hypothetical protein QR680_014318 [Steinernema hermaphroditum]
MFLTMTTALLFVLALVPSTSGLCRIYKHANLTVKIVIPTSACRDAGTNSLVTVNLGYLNFKNKLTWSISTPQVDGQGVNVFEQYTWYTIEHKVPHEDFVHIEKECLCLADFDSQAQYEDCLKVNLLTFNTKSQWYNVMDGWKPGDIEVTMTYKFWYKQPIVQKSKFSVGGCKVDWVSGNSGAFLCRDRPQSENTWLPWESGLQPGTFYGCSWRNLTEVKTPKRSVCL